MYETGSGIPDSFRGDEGSVKLAVSNFTLHDFLVTVLEDEKCWKASLIYPGSFRGSDDECGHI
jgi:hypothetical protein